MGPKRGGIPNSHFQDVCAYEKDNKASQRRIKITCGTCAVKTASGSDQGLRNFTFQALESSEACRMFCASCTTVCRGNIN